MISKIVINSDFEINSEINSDNDNDCPWRF